MRLDNTCAEWHPYTLTSAPDDPFLSVHIQVCGDWTSAVYDYLSEYLDTVQVGRPNPTSNLDPHTKTYI